MGLKDLVQYMALSSLCVFMHPSGTPAPIQCMGLSGLCVFKDLSELSAQIIYGPLWSLPRMG